MKVCAQCGNKLGMMDRVCKKCGCAEFTETKNTFFGPSVTSKGRSCIYCGAALELKAKFCWSCGKPCDGSISLSFLDEKKEEPAPKAPELDFLKSADDFSAGLGAPVKQDIGPKAPNFVSEQKINTQKKPEVQSAPNNPMLAAPSSMQGQIVQPAPQPAPARGGGALISNVMPVAGLQQGPAEAAPLPHVSSAPVNTPPLNEAVKPAPVNAPVNAAPVNAPVNTVPVNAPVNTAPVNMATVNTAPGNAQVNMAPVNTAPASMPVNAAAAPRPAAGMPVKNVAVNTSVNAADNKKEDTQHKQQEGAAVPMMSTPAMLPLSGDAKSAEKEKSPATLPLDHDTVKKDTAADKKDDKPAGEKGKAVASPAVEVKTELSKEEAERKAAEEKKRAEEQVALLVSMQKKHQAEELKKHQEAEAIRKAEEAAKKAAEAAQRAEIEKKRQEEAAKRAVEQKRRQDEMMRRAAEAAKKAEEEKKKKEEEERKAAEEEAKKAAEEKKQKEEAERKAAEEAAKKAAAEKKQKEEAERKAAEEAAKKAAEAAKKAAEEKKLKEEAERKAAEEAAKKAAEEKKRAEEEAKRKAEEERRKAEEERKRREEEERKAAEEAAKKAAEERERQLKELHNEADEMAEKAIKKSDDEIEHGRNELEASLDKFNEYFGKAQVKPSISDSAGLYYTVVERLGVMYYNERSFKLAEPLIKDAALHGKNRAAVYYVEWMLRKRKDIPEEPGSLQKMLEAAIADPNVSAHPNEKIRAIYNLARVFEEGITVEKSLPDAFNCYMKCAQMGDIRSMAMVGQFYMYGDGVKKDAKEAFEWSSKAAEAGYEKGIRNVAISYDFGTGVKKDAQRAIFWYKKLLERVANDRFAMYRIAYCLADPDKEFGTKPTEEMLKEACNYAQRAVEEGEKKAEFILGYYCTLPLDGGPDLNKAAGHFSKAANHGEEKAKRWLARLVKGAGGSYSMR